MKKLKFKIYYLVVVHVTAWYQPDLLLDFWDWTIEKMEDWGWDAGVKEKHNTIIRAMADAMEKQDKNGTL